MTPEAIFFQAAPRAEYAVLTALLLRGPSKDLSFQHLWAVGYRMQCTASGVGYRMQCTASVGCGILDAVHSIWNGTRVCVFDSGMTEEQM